MSEIVKERFIATRSRRQSALPSSIPRPCSNTFRQTTSSDGSGLAFCSLTRETIVPVSNHSMCSQQKRKSVSYVYPSEQYTPSLAIQSTSREKRDLSGTKQQLRISDFAQHCHQEPDTIRSPLQKTPAPQRLSITKTGRHNLRDWDIPRRSLLQPLNPPIVRSQTINFPVFSARQQGSDTTTTASILQLSTDKVAKIDVYDALKESRMSGEEIDVMNKVQKEALNNQLRLRKAFIRSNELHQPLLSKSRTSVALQFSAQHGTEELPEDDPKSNRVMPENNKSITTIFPVLLPSIDCNISAAKHQENLKYVFTAKESAYWVGRYMSLHDRIRAEELRVKDPDNTFSLSSAEKRTDFFENMGIHRYQIVLDELRSYCRTSEALKSFDEFQASLTQRLSAFYSGDISNLSMSSKPSAEDQTSQTYHQRTTLLATRSNKQGVQKMRNSQVVDLASDHRKVFQTKPTCTKSITTGDLASLAALSPRNNTFSTIGRPADSLELRANELKRNIVPLDGTTSRRTQNMRIGYENFPVSIARPYERQQKALLASRAGRHSFLYESPTELEPNPGVAPSLGETRNLGDEGSGRSKMRSCTDISLGTHSVLTDNSSKTLIEDEHQQFPLERERPNRRSSGEIIKGIFDAGIREVRKMSRRVSGALT